MSFLKHNRPALRGAAVALALLLAAGCGNLGKRPVAGSGSTGAPGTQGSAPSGMISATRYMGQARGFFVTAGAEGDFSTAGTTVEQQKAALDAMVRFAADNKLNTIFFAPEDGETGEFDPLDYLCRQAAAGQVQVLVVVSPCASLRQDTDMAALQKQMASSAAALVKKYEVAGVVLDGLDAPGAANSAAVGTVVEAVAQAVQKADKAKSIGIAFDASNPDSAMTRELAEQLTDGGLIQLVIPRLAGSVDSTGETGYLALLDYWTAAKLGSAAELYTLNTAHSDNPGELQNQLLANAIQGGVTGAVLAPYRVLSAQTAEQNELMVSLLSAGNAQPPKAELAIPRALAITYPLNDVTLTDKEVFVMGTSDPGKPLTVDGQPVERRGTEGTFGVAIQLVPGENRIVAAQGDQQSAVRLYRADPPTGSKPITKITAGSLFPTSPLGLDCNQRLEISCIGPATGNISATVNGETIVLVQTKTAAAGLPVLFQGSIQLKRGDFDDNKVANIGKVTYVTSFGGNHEVQKSEGDIFVAGWNVPLTIEVMDGLYVASVLTDLSSDDNFTQSLKTGARAAVTGRATATRNGNPVLAYKLASGGYILSNKVKIVENPAHCTANLTELQKTSGDGWEQYAFVGGQPGVLSEQKGNTLVLRFLNAKLTADPATMTGGLIQQVQQAETKDGFTLTLTFAEGTLWGYDITHGEQATQLFLRRTPKASTTFGKPLEGIQIMLDPGHGATDPGALGVAGVTGPTESILNMAVSNVTKFRLEQLGAQVTMTRQGEEAWMSLDARDYLAAKEHPHFFLAIHHNSAALNKDLNDTSRMEAYYWEPIAKPLAEHLMRRLTQTLARTPTDPENAYYYVTRHTFAPAVLFELGFMINPTEYEESCTQAALLKAANGIAMAIVDTVRS
ncbi:MAG: N-acetylmuramoyl-L-alanine amidase [Angelakisella sp.]